MSRVYRVPPPSTIRRPPAATGPSQRPAAPTSTTNRSMTRGVQPPIRGRMMHTQPPRQEKRDESDPYSEGDRTHQQEPTTHVGDGFHMFTPSITKREQMRRQAENEQRQYEAHVERTRIRGIHEVHRLGGDELSEDEVRRRQAEKYRREKFARLEKTHQDHSQKKQEEEREIEAKKQAARGQSMENDKRDRNTQFRSMKPTTNEHNQGAGGWTDSSREEDRRETMDRFFNRFTQQYENMNISSDQHEDNTNTHATKAEKLSILRDMLPHVDDQTLEYHLEIYDGNVDAIAHELLN